MKIIAGAIKGRKLKFKKEKNIRPTSQMVKEALFNIIGNDLSGKNFLDLFAGTGNVGIEALSRGARQVVFVEKNFNSFQIIKKNLTLVGFIDKAKVFFQDVIKFIRRNKNQLKSFDFIFLDPPYQGDLGEKVMQELGKNAILKKTSLVIFEHYFKKNLPEEFGVLEKIKDKRYGETLLSFYSVKHERI